MSARNRSFSMDSLVLCAINMPFLQQDLSFITCKDGQVDRSLARLSIYVCVIKMTWCYMSLL